ncbi:MAG: hypothetical protein P8X57_01435 [Cyclobacteriaceae bacterium]
MSYTQPIPDGFEVHQFKRTFILNHSRKDVWEILMRQSTFTDTQVWPFRVEFDKKERYMRTGSDNMHHGPFMLFSGVITKVSPPSYRDLHYYSGSYFGSIRWIRPARLQFTLEDNQGSTHLYLELTSYVKPWISFFWSQSLKLFWSNFGRWLNRHIRKQIH